MKNLKLNISLDGAAIALILGCLPLLFMPKLPTLLQWYMIGITGVVVAILLWLLNHRLIAIIHNIIKIILIILIAFLWSTASAICYLSTITPYIDSTEKNVTAKVITVNVDNLSKQLPLEEIKTSHYILFHMQKINERTLAKVIPVAVLWKDSETPVYAGQIWQLDLHFRTVHSQLNEGGFDSQRWAMANRTILQAKVRNARLLRPEVSLRQSIISHSLQAINSFSYADILIALTFGERSRITTDNKLLLSQTGIAHLMAISGMHITLVAYVGWLLARGLQFFLPTRYIFILFPWLVSGCLALFYTWLSGMNPPALRAMLALSLWLLLRYKGVYLSSWQLFIRGVALLLLFDPFMILSDSFWLSCYAVMSLIFLYHWMALPSQFSYKKRWYILQLLHLQLGLMFLLLPIQIFIFQGVSYGALWANFIAIPIVSLITFPLILIALLSGVSGFTVIHEACFAMANYSLELMFLGISPIKNSWIHLSPLFLSFSIVGWYGGIIWRLGLWRRFFGTCLTIVFITLLPLWKTTNTDELWRIDILDVGHGLAIVLRQGSSAIIYDTGQIWATGSAAEKVIIPFLRWHHLTLEGIIISHEDSDHIGGLATLQKAFPDSWLISSSQRLSGEACIQGNRWQWGELSLEAIWPLGLKPRANNDDSCVIRVTDGEYSILLTGDLGKNQELALVAQYKEQLSATLLQIPHHGSNTSSSYPFLHYVGPEVAINSVARYSPWPLPSDTVMGRYRNRGIPTYTTDFYGQISVSFYKDSWAIAGYRQKIKPRWFHDWFGSLPNYR